MILRKNDFGSAFLPMFLLFQMTPWCWWIPTHVSQSRPQESLLPKKHLAVLRGIPQGRLNFTLPAPSKRSSSSQSSLPSLHFKVAVYVCHARISGVLFLCSQVCHPPGCLSYSGHTVQVHIHWCLKVLTVLTAFGGYLQKFKLNLNL